MYSDPSLIRDHVTKIRLNDNEDALVDAVVNYTGQPRAALIRELLLEQAKLVLAGQADYAPRGALDEGPQLALFGT